MFTGAPVAEVGPDDGPPSEPLVGGVDGALAVVLSVAEEELVGFGVSVGLGEGGELSAGGVVVGCVLGSEVDCCPEHAANASAAREEKVSAVRRLTDLVLYFIRISYV